jgi:glycosyltransferase involved in cell wall biosynthesis
MRIAFFTDTYAPEINGVSHTLKRLAGYLRSQHVEHLFFAPHYGSDAVDSETMIDAETESVIRVKSMRAPIYSQSRIALPSYAKLKAEADAFKPDIVHVTTALPIGWCGMKYAREHNLPLVMSYHTNFDLYLKYYKLEYLERWLHGYLRWFHDHADLNLAPSFQTQSMLIAKGYPRVGVWSRGIDCGHFQPAAQRSEKPFTFLYVGRMAAEKGLDIYNEAIDQFSQHYRGPVRFVFTGDGPYLDTLIARTDDHIKLTGFKTGNDLADIYRSANCFVCPSSSETFGNVMLEAMASGLPVICADRGGQLDFARHMQNSIHFKSEDAESLSRSLLMAVEHPALMARLAAHALQTAQQRTWGNVFSKLLQDYGRLIEARKLGERFIC